MAEQRKLDGHRSISMLRNDGGSYSEMEGSYVAVGTSSRALPVGGPRGPAAKAIRAEEQRREEHPYEY
jgi:hypothetical protein